MNKKVVPILLAFLCMGFGDASGFLVGVVKESFGTTNLQAGFIATSGFLGFGILSVITGIIQYRVGKKAVLITGLLFFLVGTLIPVFGISYPVALVTVLIMGFGAAILQVAGNPIMRDVSAPGKYSRNLTFGQLIKAFGTLTTPIVVALVGTAFGGAWFLIKAKEFTVSPEGLREWTGNMIDKNISWRIIFPIFSVIILLTLVSIIFMKIEEKKVDGEKPTSIVSCFKALGNPFILFMVVGIFLYVGAEVSMSSKLSTYFSEKYSVDLNQIGMLSVGIFAIALTIGRFLGSVVLNWIKPQTFLVISALIAIIGTSMVMIPNEIVSWIAVFIIGIGFANLFPLIFSITVDKYPEQTNEISGLMVTAIVGGAIIPLLTGYIADLNLTLSFVVPLACITYIAFVAFISLKDIKK